IWAAHPNYARDQVAAALLGSTDDIDALDPRFAGQLGSGRLNAGRAVTTTTLAAPRIESLDGLPASGATVDQRATIDGFDVSFDQVMDSTTVNSSSNWDLRGAGLDGQFDTTDDVVYSLQSTQYMVGTNRLHVAIGPTALSTGAHRLTLSNRLANPFGVKLDGDNDGVGGDSYVRNFTVGLAAPRQLAPKGSLIYEAPVRGVLTSAGVIDRYRYQLDAGQTLTVRLTPSAALRGQVNVTSPGGTQLGAVAAAAPGDEALLQTLRIDSAGEYEVAVSGVGGTSGGYSLDLYLNAAVETETKSTTAAANNSLQTAQDLSSSFITLAGGASRGAVLGGVVTDVVQDGFESNDFKTLPWQTSGDAPWTITAADSRTGAFSAVSGSIGDNQQSTLSLKTTTGAGLVRFARRVSSEYAFDVLIFAVDGIERGRWSGKNQGFVDESFEVEAGTHTFSWTYQKDYGAIDGTDQAFIDDIELPVVADPADWYRLTLNDGQTASVALTQFAGVPTRLELYDSAGRLLAVGNSAANVDQRIDGYRDSTVDGGATDYFVRVETLDDYSLVVTRGVEFEVEPNDASGVGGVGDLHQSGAAILGAIDDRDSSITKLARDFAGQSLNDTTCGCEPPDTHAAVGLHHVVEIVNSAVAIYTKDGAKVGQSIELTDFFRSDIVAGETFLFDPVVAY
ncbi:MAG TPA: hypothetical protein PLV92_17680, partial [Pirellulaceae bacterium]|nr:hypothetical protein [Pirellulaceae bacterium]